MQNRRFEKEPSEYKERLVAINRVAKVVKGGKNFRFTALMVVGNENGKVGVGLGKAAEIPEAVRKGIEDAKRHMIEVPIVGTTIPHQVEGKFGKGHVRMLPAEEGTGVIAGGDGRHPRHPHQVLRLQQPRQLREGHAQRAFPAAHGRAGR